MSANVLAGSTIVFDLDGTLVDTAPDIAGALNTVLAREGLAGLSLAEVRPLIGGGPRAALQRAFAARHLKLEEPRLSALKDAFLAAYGDRIAKDSRPFPGAPAALDALAAAGAKLAVCTNKLTFLAVALLKALGLADRFAAIVGPDLAGAAKPDPAHLRFAIVEARGRPERALMVGDSETDAAAARAAGMPLVLVDFGYPTAPLAELAPDVLISRFADLPTACARLLGPGAAAIAACPAADA